MCEIHSMRLIYTAAVNRRLFKKKNPTTLKCRGYFESFWCYG